VSNDVETKSQIITRNGIEQHTINDGKIKIASSNTHGTSADGKTIETINYFPSQSRLRQYVTILLTKVDNQHQGEEHWDKISENDNNGIKVQFNTNIIHTIKIKQNIISPNRPNEANITKTNGKKDGWNVK